METVRKDTTPEMLFQVPFSAIFLENKELKRCRFTKESDRV
jgi:hypothetical protein